MYAVVIPALIIWFFAHMVSPIGTSISLGRSFGVTWAFVGVTLACRFILGPILGPLWLLIAMLLSVALIHWILYFPWLRSLVLYFVYLAILAVMHFGIAHLNSSYKKLPNQSLQPTPRSVTGYANAYPAPALWRG
jgi:hypothetical protein